ncbi:ATP-binding cassette domain-containing protein [uncultured Robinsoniella sp.]|uniref:ATP-binding cassette domain-containing protein n=1 Tax=Robinsoniella sp. TaxID=2496533 RepID=UPI00374EEB66
MISKNISIDVKGLKKSYKKVSVLNNVNFEVETGTIFSLLGSNGAGKTTTIKILSTLIKPDSGSINVCGYNVRKEPHKIHEVISLTGQFSAVDETLTGLENLILIGKLTHLPNVKERANELLTYFDLVSASNRLVSTYSGGMRRKLDIAMSLVNSPSVLFLDEPTTGLDPQSRHNMWEIIKDLKNTGTTIFLTTQYLEEAEQLADNIAILDKGSIIVEGTLEELKKLLPQEIVEFEFPSKQDYEKALSLLKEYRVTSDQEKNQLTVYTLEAIKVLTKLFQLFTAHNINIKDVSRKSPSLEDVFLTLIGEKEALKNE